MKKLSFLFAFACIVFSCNNDDDLIAACDTATNISATSVSTTSATMTWSDTNNAGSYFIEYGVSGFALGSGITLIESETTTDLQNLLPETTYDVYIQVVCSTDNLSMYTNSYSFTTATLSVIPEFRPNLSELNLFSGNLGDLNPTSNTFEYDLQSTLFSDYSHKQRFIALPEGTKLEYDGDGLPIFPDNSVISKTFYYNNDETDLSQGTNIIETRVLIKIDGSWETGDYKWNEAQTDAVLDLEGSIVPVTWIDADGETNSVNYQIPSDSQCFTCHRTNEVKRPIGPRLRSLNFNLDGVNQLQNLIDNDLIEGLSEPSTVSVLPKWDDEINYTLEERARAYFDINCAHCHTDGGYCEDQSTLRFDYETSFAESNILNRKNSIINRVSSEFQPGLTMPWIGTTILHDEGVELLLEYLDTL